MNPYECTKKSTNSYEASHGYVFGSPSALDKINQILKTFRSHHREIMKKKKKKGFEARNCEHPNKHAVQVVIKSFSTVSRRKWIFKHKVYSCRER